MYNVVNWTFLNLRRFGGSAKGSGVLDENAFAKSRQFFRKNTNNLCKPMTKNPFQQACGEQSAVFRTSVPAAKVLHYARNMVISFAKASLTKKTFAFLWYVEYYFHLWFINPNNSSDLGQCTQLIHFSIPPPMLVFYVVAICLLVVRVIPYVSSYLETGLRR